MNLEQIEQKIKTIFDVLPNVVRLNDVDYFLNIIVCKYDGYLPTIAYYGDNDKWVYLSDTYEDVKIVEKRLLLMFFEEFYWVEYNPKHRELLPELFQNCDNVLMYNDFHGVILINEEFIGDYFECEET